MSNTQSTSLEDTQKSHINSLQNIVLNKEGKISLHNATENGNIELVKELIDSGVDINAKNHDGKTPLYIATQYNNNSIVKLLLGNPGLNANTFRNGKAPLFVACENGYQEIVKILLDDHRCVQHVNIDYKGSKPLHVAIKQGYKEIVNDLLGRDSDVNALDSDRCSPLWLALINEQEEITETLLNDNRVDVNLQYQNNTPLQFAIQGKNSNISKRIIKNGGDITVTDNDGRTPLHHAVDKGLMDVVHCLIKEGADIHVVTKRGNTPLHIAAMDGELEIAKLLIENGANVDKRGVGCHGLTPLQLAVKNIQLDLAKYLIEKGADVNATDPDAHYAVNKGGTLLHWIAREYDQGIQEKIIRFLVENGADVNATADDGRTPLCLLVKHNGSFDTMRFFIENGASLNNVKGGSPLYWAFYMDYGGNYPEVANFLIEMGTDVNGTIDYFGDEFDSMRTALHLAKNLSTVKLLIEKGANVNAVDKNGNTPLHTVRKLSIAKYLIKNGANVNFPNNEGYTPLHVAENFLIAKLLIEQGADVNATTDKGYTPLHFALNVPIAELLIEKGADFKAFTSDGKTVLHSAAESDIFGHMRYKEVPDLINFFVQLGLDVNKVDFHGNTPLHCCGEVMNIEVAARLLEYGADINVTNNDNKPPLCCDRFYDDGGVSNFGRMFQSIDKLFTAIETDSSLSEIKRRIMDIRTVNYVFDSSKLTILHLAVKGNRKDVVEFLLLEKRSLRDMKLISSKKLIRGKGEASRYKDSYTPILEKINVNACCKDRWTPLHYAAQGNNLDIVRLLLESGAAYDVETNEGKQPIELTQSNEIRNLLLLVKTLFDSVKKGNYEEVVQYIKVDKSIINAVEKDGRSPLHWSIKKNYQNIVSYLLDNGASCTGVTNGGETVLHFAATSEAIIIECLLDHVRCIGRSDELVNAKTSDGNTAFHIATKNGSLEVVKSLMNYGAIYDLKNEEGATPLDLSTNQEVTDLMKIVNDLFDDAGKNNPDILIKLQNMEPVLFNAVINVRNYERNTLEGIVKLNEYAYLLEGILILLAERGVFEKELWEDFLCTKDEFEDINPGFGLFD